jgi:hypothetical protein
VDIMKVIMEEDEHESEQGFRLHPPFSSLNFGHSESGHHHLLRNSVRNLAKRREAQHLGFQQEIDIMPIIREEVQDQEEDE